MIALLKYRSAIQAVGKATGTSGNAAASDDTMGFNGCRRETAPGPTWAAWDIHRAKVFGRCEIKNGTAPVERLLSEVMTQEPYKSARRVFWIMDNCSAHRDQKAAERFRTKWPNSILIHTPIHASCSTRSRSILDRTEKSPHV